MDETTCPKAKDCANADIKCHLCQNFNCFKTGASRGKGSYAEKKAKQIRTDKPHLRKGSGAAAHAKGDLIDSKFLYEVKSGYASASSKGSKTFTLKREWLLKIEKEALAEGRAPILMIKFDGSPDDELWTITRSTTFFDMTDAKEETQQKEEQ